jgi:2-methylisocitrate lyase-like PEP mutase family enzyme
MTTFRHLHHGPAILMLPNAWDAGSARLIESLGAKAIATSSAGMAWSLGYADGNALANDDLIAATRRIARVVAVPLSIDIEHGYSDDEGAVARLTTGITDAGAQGINIEDGAGSPDALCRKIAAIRSVASDSGSELFINARTDVYLRRIAVGDAAVDEVIDRAARYRSAGSDGLFVPGLIEAEAISNIAAAIHPMPLNVMAAPALPSIEELRKLGVRRVSAGSAIAQSIHYRTARLASAFLEGDVGELFEASAEYGKMNGLFAQPPLP